MASLEQRRKCGYSCSQFVETPPEYIRCRVCRNVLREPHLTECCGRNVCHPCIEEAETTDGPCPLDECRKPHVKVSFNRKCRNDIDECRVFCSSKENGCQWVDKLEKLQRHLNECAYVEEPCPYDCGDIIQRRDVEDHQKVCKCLKLECKCGTMYERQHLSRHLKVCKLTRVQCPFNIVGCKVEVVNMELHHHLSECLAEHHSLVEALNRDTKTKVVETKQTVLREHEEEIKRLDAEVDELDGAIVDAHYKISVLQQALRSGQEQMGEMQKINPRTTSILIADQVSASDAEVQKLAQSFYQLHFETKLKCYGPPLPRPLQIFSRPQEAPPTENPLVPPLSFTILGFQEKKKYDAVVYSAPFLTHRRGYKMCLQIFCNGDEQSKGKWLSIYVYLMKGEYDDFLRWPFSGSITVEVRNMLNNTNHHGKTTNFYDRSDPFQEVRSRVTGEDYISSKCLGHSRFMPLTTLFPRFALIPDYQYIKNDSLRIDVTNVKVFNKKANN